jgi:hypothetical protein
VDGSTGSVPLTLGLSASGVIESVTPNIVHEVCISAQPLAATKGSAFLRALRGSLPFPPQRTPRFAENLAKSARSHHSAFLRALPGSLPFPPQ